MSQSLPKPIDLETTRLNRVIKNACSKVAPNWPLDQLIAVNPYWEMRDRPFVDVAARLSALANIHSLMPFDYWQSLYEQGQITDQALADSARLFSVDKDVAQLVEELTEKQTEPKTWQNLSALFDQHRTRHQVSWHEEIIHQISQFCAAYYQRQQPILEQVDDVEDENRLYKHWLTNIRNDSGISILMGEKGLAHTINHLPEDLDQLFKLAFRELELDLNTLEIYCHALLLDINGWAAFVAYQRWQSYSDDMKSLLGIRLAWELAIWRHIKSSKPEVADQVSSRWSFEKSSVENKFAQHAAHQRQQWVWHVAYELTEQQRMQAKLLATEPQELNEVVMQAVFCIDVRSEVIRRALESQNSQIETRGFAGFFGMPIDYHPEGTHFSRPQLPGLLQPAITAREIDSDSSRSAGIERSAGWRRWSHTPTGAFSMVESAGWWYGFKLLKQMWFPKGDKNPVNELSEHRHWQLSKDDQPLSVDDQAELAAGILHAMGMKRFAPIVMLIGHGSHTTNNLQAAGLDCGACGGQSGEVNVRVLVELLNNSDVRAALNEKGVGIPHGTRFVAGVHNTTTDDIRCFDGNLPDKAIAWLDNAKQLAQKERAQLIDRELPYLSAQDRDKAFQARAKDWSQVRPEWGLANNSTFIIAPRSWTRNANFEGRSFLHDYVWQQDSDQSVLELLITAPMVVTNWINMQYNASVTDNFKFGSGNKVLHNAVGGNIGVFEGNGGDLRIGLAMQSLHNGHRWMHQPQRLSVYIAAPKEHIEKIVEANPAIKQLVDNDWLYLFCWQNRNKIERYYHQEWFVTRGTVQ